MISIICPFYNEKECLQELYTRLLKATQSLQDPWEMIFVNDGSTDEGHDFLKRLIKGEESVCLVELDRNYGLTTAMYAGLQTAKGEILVTLDADLQNPPEEIPRLVSLLQDFDMVTGVRRERRDNWLRKMSSRLANAIRKFVLGDTIQDIGCSLRVFKRPALQAFHPYQGMHRFFAAVAQAQGFKILQVPVDHHKRLYGQAKYGLRNRLAGPLWDLIAVKWLMTKKIDYRLRSLNYG